MSDSPVRRSATAASGQHAPSLSWQAISFAAVGVSGTAVTFVLLTVLHKGLGWKLELANVPAYAAGIVNNYFWNRVWTFRHVERRNLLHQGSQFAAVSIGGLIINTMVLSAYSHLRGNGGFNFYIAFGLAAVAAYGWNFYLNHRLTFRHHLPHPHLHSRGSVAVPGEGD